MKEICSWLQKSFVKFNMAVDEWYKMCYYITEKCNLAQKSFVKEWAECKYAEIII